MTAGPAVRTGPSLSWIDVLAAARSETGPVRVLDLIRLCESAISRAGLTGFNSMGSPRKDAEALVFEPLGIRDHSSRYLDAALTRPETAAVLDLLERRVSGPTPVPYLTGEAFFAGRRFGVRAGVFIPRSALGALLDEVLVEVRWSSPASLALEIGCGSGALGLSIALRVPGLQIHLHDVDPLAVEVTGENIARHRLSDRASTALGDMYGAVDPAARYDLIVANLPYVPISLQGRHNGEIDAEPAAAVYRPGDGLDLVRTALGEAALHLAEQGTLVLEVGALNEPPVRELLAGRGRWWLRDGRDAGVVSLRRDQLAG